MTIYVERRFDCLLFISHEFGAKESRNAWHSMANKYLGYKKDPM